MPHRAELLCEAPHVTALECNRQAGRARNTTTGSESERTTLTAATKQTTDCIDDAMTAGRLYLFLGQNVLAWREHGRNDVTTAATRDRTAERKELVVTQPHMRMRM